MHFKYGKVKFGYKDSWSAEPGLSKIIADWLQNYRDVVWEKRDHDFIGCPHSILVEFFPREENHTYTDDEIREGFKKWMELVDEMIYAFRNVEPEFEDFDVKFVPGPEHDVVDERGLIRWNMVPTDEESYERYKDARRAHEKRVLAGRELFAKYYDNLWW